MILRSQSAIAFCTCRFEHLTADRVHIGLIFHCHADDAKKFSRHLVVFVDEKDAYTVLIPGGYDYPSFGSSWNRMVFPRLSVAAGCNTHIFSIEGGADEGQ